jgi:3-hydroxyanthranilate 3,4-dioxygenase
VDRKRMLQLFHEAQSAWGSFDDFPALPPGTDPMPHISRNTVSQPFYLVSDQDQVLINFAGEGELWLKGNEPERMALVAGDSVYLPAGIPSRVVTHTPSLQVRFKAETPGREAVVWYCPGCGNIVDWRSIDTGQQLPQEVYWEAIQAFNDDAARRTCRHCGTIHPRVDLGDIAWPAVAAAIRRAQG